MNRLMRRLNALTLRERFLVAPLIGLVLVGMLLATFVYESERQNALLTRIAARDFKSFEANAEIFAELSAQHIALYELLSRAEKTTEEELYDQAKGRLYAIHAAIDRIESALPADEQPARVPFLQRRELLVRLTHAYRRGVTSAVEMTTVNRTLAPSHIAIANERFIAVNRAFNGLLDLQREELSSEIGVRVERSERGVVLFALAGMLGAAFLLLVSLALSRLLSRSLETQIDALSELGGCAQHPGDAPNEVERMGQAIATFKKAAERVSYLAHYDALTNLPNRTLFRDRLAQGMARQRRSDALLAVMLLDLDRFKEINDTLGHTAGDEALQLVARRLSAVLREVDTIARLGGDEFAVIVEESKDIQQIVSVAERINTAFAEPLLVHGREFFVTTSIGVALHPEHGRDVEELLQRADVALYRAKEEGRSTWQIYSAEMNAEAGNRLAMERLLRRAIERDELVLHYQPKVALGTGEIVGAEALLRWRSAELGLVSPADFIPLAEETGLIVPIGEWVLRTACAQARAWRDAGAPPLLMSVNISPRQFRQKDLVETIASVLADTGLEPPLLELEITEGTVMHHVEHTHSVLNELNRLGVQLSIDDFGTGYSSLSYLKRFPVQRLKIDQSFIRGVTHDSNDAAIVTAVVAMARKLKLKLVAEGVETEDQRAFLESLECDEYQGYHFSKAVPPEQFAALLETHSAQLARPFSGGNVNFNTPAATQRHRGSIQDLTSPAMR